MSELRLNTDGHIIKFGADYVELYTKFYDGGSASSNNYYTDSTTFQAFRITGV